MTEFQHYALESDSFAILKDLLAEGFAAVAEEPVLREPQLTTFTSLSTELEDKLRRYPNLLLEGEFTNHPLEFVRRDAGDAIGTYYADQTVGPRIRWSLAGVNASGHPYLTPGSLSYASSYRDPPTNTWARPSTALKSAFKKMVRVFEQHMVMIAVKGDHVWVGKDAKKALDAGTVALER